MLCLSLLWILGGLTDLDTLTLLCRHYHAHFLQKGWTCRVKPDDPPEWTLPWSIGQDQRSNSTHESDGCVPNANRTPGADDHRTPHEASVVPLKPLYGSRRPGTHLAAFSSVGIRLGMPPSSALRCTHLNDANRKGT